MLLEIILTIVLLWFLGNFLIATGTAYFKILQGVWDAFLIFLRGVAYIYRKVRGWEDAKV